MFVDYGVEYASKKAFSFRSFEKQHNEEIFFPLMLNKRNYCTYLRQSVYEFTCLCLPFLA